MLIAVLVLSVSGLAIVRAGSWQRRTDRRIGLLGAPAIPTSTAEAARTSRLLQLGEAGTCRVYNCGKILRVDYERGELVISRRPARFDQAGEADVCRVHNCGKILHVIDYERGDLIVERELVEPMKEST